MTNEGNEKEEEWKGRLKGGGTGLREGRRGRGG